MTYAREEVSKLTLNVIGDLWRFPLWWYTSGLKLVGKYCLESLHNTWERLALGLFLRYFFKPMYGDYTISGRAVSLLMRIVLVIYKSIRLIFWLLWYLTIFLIWLVLLPLSLIFIFI